MKFYNFDNLSQLVQQIHKTSLVLTLTQTSINKGITKRFFEYNLPNNTSL